LGAHDSLVPERMPPGTYAVVELADTGTGMDEATLHRAFEPFFTTKENGRGTGLGLAMVYGFAKQSGGHASIYSEVGHGTSIRLYLPWGAAGAVREPAASALPQPVERGHETVVIVDDEEALLGIGRMWLEKLGYQVVAYSDPHAALAHIARGGTCDVLVTDVIMPTGLDGPALAQKAREHRPDLPVLLTSGFAERSIRRTQALPGPLLQKPYRQGDLGRMVREVLDKK
jgi:CheY-like chemotaxis protein